MIAAWLAALDLDDDQTLPRSFYDDLCHFLQRVNLEKTNAVVNSLSYHSSGTPPEIHVKLIVKD